MLEYWYGEDQVRKMSYVEEQQVKKCYELEKEMDKCQFCGEKAELLYDEFSGFLPSCSVCDGMIEKWFDTPEEAVERWNERV